MPCVTFVHFNKGKGTNALVVQLKPELIKRLERPRTLEVGVVELGQCDSSQESSLPPCFMGEK